jgi:hypothetical protein
VAAPTYKELSRTVLLAVDDIYPNEMSNFELKTLLKPELSDSELLDVLDGLHHQGFVDGKGVHESQSGQRKLAVMAAIRITKKGQDEIADKSLSSPAVVQTFINNGQTGAIGPHSVGTINYQSQWQAVEGQVDLTALATELGNAIKQQQPTASSRADYEELALLAEAKEHAEKHEGGKLMESLSKIGQSVAPVLAKAGAEGLVHWIEHKTGTKLS